MSSGVVRDRQVSRDEELQSEKFQPSTTKPDGSQVECCSQTQVRPVRRALHIRTVRFLIRGFFPLRTAGASGATRGVCAQHEDREPTRASVRPFRKLRGRVTTLWQQNLGSTREVKRRNGG